MASSNPPGAWLATAGFRGSRRSPTGRPARPVGKAGGYAPISSGSVKSPIGWTRLTRQWAGQSLSFRSARRGPAVQPLVSVRLTQLHDRGGAGWIQSPVDGDPYSEHNHVSRWRN